MNNTTHVCPDALLQTQEQDVGSFINKKHGKPDLVQDLLALRTQVRFHKTQQARSDARLWPGNQQWDVKELVIRPAITQTSNNLPSCHSLDGAMTSRSGAVCKQDHLPA